MLLPNAPDKYNRIDQTQMRDELLREDRLNLKKGRDIEFGDGEALILHSPNGSRFAVTVDNAGALGTTAL